MDDYKIEQLIITGIKIGTIATIKRFGLAPEVVPLKKAYAIYTKEMVERWRAKGWITGYATGNTKNSKVYFKRSELEMASVMLELGNLVPENHIYKRGEY